MVASEMATETTGSLVESGLVGHTRSLNGFGFGDVVPSDNIVSEGN